MMAHHGGTRGDAARPIAGTAKRRTGLRPQRAAPPTPAAPQRWRTRTRWRLVLIYDAIWLGRPADAI